MKFWTQQGYNIISTVNKFGRSGFHHTCLYSHEKVVKFLTQQGYDIATVGENGRSRRHGFNVLVCIVSFRKDIKILSTFGLNKEVILIHSTEMGMI